MKWVFIFSVDFDKINLDNDKNVDKDDPETIIHVKLWAWDNKFDKRETLKNYTSENERLDRGILQDEENE